MTEDEYEPTQRFYQFEPAPTGSNADERIAVALEFLAKQSGDIAQSLSHLNNQMDSLISNVS